jgi:hypothetical protein
MHGGCFVTNPMRKLTPEKLERLRGVATSMLEAPLTARIDLGIAPEDLVVACDRALGWDAMTDETDDEKHALVDSSHQQCAAAWRVVMGNNRTSVGDRVYAVLSATAAEVSLLGFGVYVGDEVPPAPMGITRAVFGVATWEEFDRVVAEDTDCQPNAAARPTNPKILLDTGEVVWGAECWWGPEAAYAKFRGGRTEKRCLIAAERKKHA